MKKRLFAVLVCLCMVISMLPVSAFAEGGDTDGSSPAEPVCICETLCTEGAVDAACPVCSAEGADLSACKGEAPAPPSTEPLRAPKAGESPIYVSDLALTGSASNPVYAKCGTTAIYKLTLGGNENDYNVKWDGSTLTLWNATLGANVNSNAIRF